MPNKKEHDQIASAFSLYCISSCPILELLNLWFQWNRSVRKSYPPNQSTDCIQPNASNKSVLTAFILCWGSPPSSTVALKVSPQGQVTVLSPQVAVLSPQVAIFSPHVATSVLRVSPQVATSVLRVSPQIATFSSQGLSSGSNCQFLGSVLRVKSSSRQSQLCPNNNYIMLLVLEYRHHSWWSSPFIPYG